MLSLYHYTPRGWRRLGYEVGKLLLIGVSIVGLAAFCWAAMLALEWSKAR